MKNLEDYEDGNGYINLDLMREDYKINCNDTTLNFIVYIKTPKSLYYKYFEELNRYLTENEIIEYGLIISNLKHKSEFEKIDILEKIIFHHINEYDLQNNFNIILKEYIPYILRISPL